MEKRVISDRTYFIHIWEENRPLDWTAVRMMEQNDVDGLLPFKFVRLEKEKYFRYEADGKETLEEWLGRVHYKEDVMKLLVNLVFTGEELGAYLLEQNHICIDTAFIAVNGDKCEAAYLPEEEGQDDIRGNILQLAKRIIMSVKYALDEDFTYLFDLQNAFGREDIQNLTDLKKWLRIADRNIDGNADGNRERNAKLKERGAEQADREWNAASQQPGRNEKMGSTPAAAPERNREEKSGSLEGIFGGLGSGNKKGEKSEKKGGEKKGIFQKKIKKDKKEKGKKPVIEEIMDRPAEKREPAYEKEIINDLNRDNMTVMTGTQDCVLVKEKNGMEYSLVRDCYTVGKDPQSDIVVQNNPTVSRKHARIFMHESFYFIEDLGSTNGTYVNGEKLRKMEPYKLDGRAKIQFSNENYIFEIRE